MGRVLISGESRQCLLSGAAPFGLKEGSRVARALSESEAARSAADVQCPEWPRFPGEFAEDAMAEEPFAFATGSPIRFALGGVGGYTLRFCARDPSPGSCGPRLTCRSLTPMGASMEARGRVLFGPHVLTPRASPDSSGGLMATYLLPGGPPHIGGEVACHGPVSTRVG